MADQNNTGLRMLNVAEEVVHLNQRIRERDTEYHDLLEVYGRELRRTTELQETNREKDIEIEQLNGQIASRDNELQQHHEKDTVIEHLNEQLVAKEFDIQQQSNEFNDLNTRFNTLEQTLTKERTAVEDLEYRFQTIKQQLQDERTSGAENVNLLRSLQEQVVALREELTIRVSCIYFVTFSLNYNYELQYF